MKLLVISVLYFLVVNAESHQQQWKQYKEEQMSSSDDIPESFDWRKSVGVLLPRNMTNIEHSWAFAVAAAIEVGLFKYNGTLEYISVQHMLDCVDYKTVLGAFYYYFLNGARTDEFYPYTGQTQDCQWDSGRFFISYDYVDMNETSMKAIVAQKGLLTVSIDGINLPSYTHGIIDESQCEQKEENYKSPWNAAIVGYGTENGTDYWILKNSLGTEWGEDGYFRLKRNVNACGVANEVWSTEVVAHS